MDESEHQRSPAPVRTAAYFDMIAFAHELRKLADRIELVQNVSIEDDLDLEGEQTRTLTMEWYVTNENADLFDELPFDGGEYLANGGDGS